MEEDEDELLSADCDDELDVKLTNVDEELLLELDDVTLMNVDDELLDCEDLLEDDELLWLLGWKNVELEDDD